MTDKKSDLMYDECKKFTKELKAMELSPGERYMADEVLYIASEAFKEGWIQCERTSGVKHD